MVGDQGELPPEEVILEGVHHLLYHKALLLHNKVLLLPRKDLPADIHDWVLHAFLLFGQDGPYPRLSGPGGVLRSPG